MTETSATPTPTSKPIPHCHCCGSTRPDDVWPMRFRPGKHICGGCEMDQRMEHAGEDD